jgi:hypothetical protein
MCRHKLKILKTISILLPAILIISSIPSSTAKYIPVTEGEQDTPLTRESSEALDITLSSFVNQLNPGSQGQVIGLYVPQKLAQPVVQQPRGQGSFVSAENGVITQFSMAAQYGSLGFLAHNYLAGIEFYEIDPGDSIYVIYGDGHIEKYHALEIRRYQALQPDSTQSTFVDLETGDRLDAASLFYQTYGVSGQLILQTCIAQGEEDSWGRLFIVATQFNPSFAMSIKQLVSRLN